MAKQKDYTSYPFLLAITVIGMLLLMGMIPPFQVAGIKTKKINILSDLYDAQNDADCSQEYSDTSFTAESLLAASPERIEEAQSTPTGTSQSWDIHPHGAATPLEFETSPFALPATPPAPRMVIDPDSYGAPATLIEDFSTPGHGMSVFYNAMNHGYAKRPVRIAVLGDSFIEADIITADLREQLQDMYGGQGPGFVPFASPLSRFRSSVKHTHNGWETYNVIKKKSAPAGVQDKFFISGNVCIPSEGAWTRIEGTTFRGNLSHCSVARLIFTNTKNSTLEVTINDSIVNKFTPEPSPLVQQINLHGEIRSIKVSITGAEGFVGYGIVLESVEGVGVDNYSVRSNSGMALFGTNSAINTQIGKLLGYDLIVLQYGLNAMSPDILNYTTYSAQLVKVVNYIRNCFPGAAVMVMSVGDRSTQRAGEYVTMPAIKGMIAAQHKATEESGTAFWNTFQGMGGERSMVKFVENKWASKDYTHIGYPGGKYIATELVRSLLYGLRAYNGEQFDLKAIPEPNYSLPEPCSTPTPIVTPPSQNPVPPQNPGDQRVGNASRTGTAEPAIPDSARSNATATRSESSTGTKPYSKNDATIR